MLARYFFSFFILICFLPVDSYGLVCRQAIEEIGNTQVTSLEKKWLLPEFPHKAVKRVLERLSQKGWVNQVKEERFEQVTEYWHFSKTKKGDDVRLRLRRRKNLKDGKTRISIDFHRTNKTKDTTFTYVRGKKLIVLEKHVQKIFETTFDLNKESQFVQELVKLNGGKNKKVIKILKKIQLLKEAKQLSGPKVKNFSRRLRYRLMSADDKSIVKIKADSDVVYENLILKNHGEFPAGSQSVEVSFKNYSEVRAVIETEIKPEFDRLHIKGPIEKRGEIFHGLVSKK